MNIIEKIQSGSMKVFAALFSLVAFAWPNVAQAAYVTQGVMAYEKRSDNNIDVKGLYYGNWTQCTYGYYGFYTYTSNLGGCSIIANPEFKSGGKYVSMSWTVANDNSVAVHGKLGAAADSMIADNDAAGIDVMMTSSGKIKGLKMVQDNPYGSSYNAQLNLYFRDTAGVTDCTTYWFGSYWGTRSYENYVFSQISDATAEPDDGYYVKSPAGEYLGLRDEDSAICLSWDVDLEPGESKTYSFLLGIGERADPPEWYYDSTKGQELEDALGLRANGRTLTSIGKATDVTTSGNIMMYVMSTPNKFGSGNELLLGTAAAAGKTTPVTLAGDFDTTGWAKGLYILDYWLVNDKGAMSADTIRKPIQIMEDGSLNADPGDETTYLVKGSCANSESFTNFTIRVFGIGQDPDNIGVATTNDFDAVVDEKGVFYSLLPDGHYDVVITAWPKDGGRPVTTTSLVNVDGAETVLTVTLPTKPVDSVINDKATKFNGTVCGGLDDLGQELMDVPGVTNVLVELDVVDKTESEPHADELAEAAIAGDPTRQCDFVDLTVWTATNHVTNIVHRTGELLKIGLPFPDPKHCFVKVHRWHDNAVQQIMEGAENANEDGEYFEIFQDDLSGEAVQGEVLLHVKNFSLYCISRGKEYATLRLYQPEQGTVELSLDADFSTLIGDKFKPVWTETNVYVRCTANEGWIFQGFDVSGLKVNDHITLSQKRDFTYDTGSGGWYWVPQFKFKETPAFSNATRKVVFDTLEELIEDPWTQDGDTVMLTRDVTIEDPLVFTRSLVFDGEGRTVKVAKPYVKEDGSIDPDASEGGIVVVESGVDVTLTNVTIKGGKGAYAIENRGTLKLLGMTVTDSNGGVANAAGAKLLVQGSQIGHNIAANGAAVANAGKAVLDNSSFVENRALVSGGALFNTAAGAKFYGNNVVFGNNAANVSGGAAAFVSGEAFFQNTTFAGNLSTNAAAGVFVGAAATVRIANAVLANDFVYDVATDTVTVNDFAAEAGATVELRKCVYTDVTGVTPIGGALAGADDLFAGYASMMRLYGASGSTAQPIDNLPVFKRKIAAEPLSLYAPLSDTAADAYKTAGVAVTEFGVDATSLLVSVKGTDYTYADETTSSAVGKYYEEGVGVRVANMPGASGTTTPVTTFTLRLKDSPTNGTVSGITLYGSAYEVGAVVSMTAKADAGFYFLGWYEEDGLTLLSESEAYDYTMPAANKVLVARFAGLQPQTGLWVEQDGWVAGDPAPAHKYGGKVGPGAESFEYAPTNDTSFWAIEKPVNTGVYYIKYVVDAAPPHAAGAATNVFMVGVTVSYDAMGGAFADGSTVTNIVTAPTGYLIPTEIPVREGYVFRGWFLGMAPDAEQPSSALPVTSTCVFARWQSTKMPPAGGLLDGEIHTPDDGGMFGAYPIAPFPDGDIALPERYVDPVSGRAVVSIKDGAFTTKQYQKKFGAPVINSVTIPAFMTSIGNYAFYGNAALTNLTFMPVYDYVTGEKATLHIGNYAFANTAITNLVFPAGGSYSLGHLAFAEIANLKDVWMLGDVTLDSLDNVPFREVGEAVGGTVFHLSPAKIADAEFVYALTNGLHMVQVRALESTATVDDTPAGTVEIDTVTVDAEITVDFTLSANAPWKTVDETTVSLLYSNDPSKLIVGNCEKLAPTSVESLGGGQYRAIFEKPAGATGFFTVCVGD